MTLCPFLKAEGWEQEPGEVSLALLPTWGLWGSLSGQGRALQREQCSLAWGGEQTGLICATDPHRLHGSEQDRDRLCRVPVRRKVPDSSPASRVSGITASSVCDAGCTSSLSERENSSCGVGTTPSPSSTGSLGSCWGKQGSWRGCGAGPAAGARHRSPGADVSGHLCRHRYSGGRRWREPGPFVLLSCAPTAASHCMPPRSSCSPAWIKTSWATS